MLVHRRTNRGRTVKSTVVVAVSALLISLVQAIAAPVASAEPTPTLSVKVSFQPTASAAPAGFTVDTGAAFSEAAGKGWIRQDSLAGAHVPFDVVKNTRDRGCAGYSLQQRTFIHMQGLSENSTTSAIPVAWEYNLPNGDYQVSVGVGDPNKGADFESHTINAEGINLVTEYPASALANCGAQRPKIATGWVRVTDGKLTIDAVGGTNTKLSFITIDSTPIEGLTATPGASSISLDWVDLAGATGYRIWRGNNLPVATTGAAIATSVASDFVDATAVKGSVYYYAVAPAGAAAPVAVSVAGSLIDDPTPATVPLPVKFSFQDAAGATPSTYTKDFGQSYANVRGFGWIVPGTNVPLSLILNGRTRTAALAAEAAGTPFQSTMHMQGNTVAGTFNGTAQPGAWQLAVPNGNYDVEVGVGDADPGTDPTTHRINVENQNVINNFVGSGATSGAGRFKVGNITAVAVSDGFLTVDAIGAGAQNTKIDYITITPSNVDQPPAKPTAVTATAGDAAVTLDWADNAETDIQGYQVYRSTDATVDISGTPINTGILTASTFVDTNLVNGTTYRYAVVAVDNANQRSVSSDTVTASPDSADPLLAQLPLMVNFSDVLTAAPTDYVQDYGLPYTNTRGRGWVTPGTSTGLDLVGNGRNRTPRTDVSPLQQTLIHMQGNDVTPPFNGVPTAGSYEVAVANGTYKVTASVGDQPGSANGSCVAPCYDSKHTINVEGISAINAFQATASAEFKLATVTVNVADGKLTIDAIGGTNTKINFLEIESLDVTAPSAPSAPVATAADASVTLNWAANTEPDLAGYYVYRSMDANVTATVANRLSATPQAGISYPDTAVTNGTQYFYAVTAVDLAGNESPLSAIVDATPADTTAPAAPQNVTAAGGVESVILLWNVNTETDLKEYQVYRSDTSPVALDAANKVATVASGSTGYTDVNRTNGVEQFYVIVAADLAGNTSVASAEISAIPTAAPDLTAPASPTLNIPVAGDGAITLSWTANTESDLAGYRVYRSATPGGVGALLTPNTIALTTFTDSTVINGTAYYYRVEALDLTGNKSAQSNEGTATAVDTTPPAVPLAFAATAGINSITLRWTANTEPDLRGYRIYRSLTPTVQPDEQHLLAVLLKAGGRTFIDTDRDAGVTYYYVITAEDQLRNESAASSVINAIPLAAPDTTPPAAPGSLTAANSDASVDLSWTASSATDVAGYSVYRSTTAGGTRVKLTSTLITATTYTDSTPAPGATYYYVVTAVDTANNESAASNESSATIVAPAGLNVKVNFQTDAAAVPTGYIKDIGSAYNTTRGFGWIRQDTLGQAVPTPLDLTGNTRLRVRNLVDPLQNTMIHMQYGDIVPTPTANGVLTPGAWEYGLPNGRYQVTASVGDQPGGAKTGCAAPCYDSTNTIRAEGIDAITAFQATATVEYRIDTVTVDVTDGKLTIDAVGGNNTKLNYVTILGVGPVTPDTTAPGAPTGFTGYPGDTTATLTWGAPVDPDVAGYNVYRSTTGTVALIAANKVNAAVLAAANFTDNGLTNATAYSYVVTAIDQSGNESAGSSTISVTPALQAGAGPAFKVNFQDSATTPTAGYLADWGQGFGSRTSTNQGTGNNYGWVLPGSSTAVSLEGNGRNRNTLSPPANQPDLRLATFMHMQLAAAVTTGVHIDASWEVAVPNGAYLVTVAVGDAGTAVDSVNWVNIENQNAVAAFTPAGGAKFATATRTIVVSDGRLTIDALGGSNTKLAYVDVAGLDRAGRPYTTTVNPGNGVVNVVPNASVTADNALNAESGAVDETTLGGGNVTLTRVSDGALVAGVGVTSGGGDTISFQADAPMAASTLYRFDIKDGAKDKGGRSFLPFSSVFTTSSGIVAPPTSSAAFDKAISGASVGKSYTTVVIGPDGKLYAGSIYGQIYRWTINADGSLSGEQVINTVRTHATASGWEGAPNRTVIGMAFDPASTPTNPILWITDNYAYLGPDVPDATGAIAKLTGANLENYQEIVVNLPRSIKDHETNSIALKDGIIYLAQGSMNAMGNTDGTWKKAEHLLSASILRLDPSKLPTTLPLDVATPDVNAPARNGVPAHVGTYNPYAPNAALTLYATGVRNAFDLAWHSNGRLYAGTNGSAAGGSTPATPNPLPASCANRPDGGYTGPTAPGIGNNGQAETDYIFDIHQGKYYGHPNPTRCEYVLNAGNPTGYTGNPLFKVNQYPAGQLADPNYDLANVYDAGLHASANGTIEYKNTNAFGGSLAGKLIVVRYSANQEIVAFNVAANGSLSPAVTGITGFTGFAQPLDITEDVTKGNLYVTELTNNPATTRIVLLRPQGGSGSVPTAAPTDRVVYTDVKGGAPSAAKSVVVKNIGGAPLTITAASIVGADAALFARAGGPTLPVIVPAGGTAVFPVTFAPTAAGPRGATMQFATNDAASPISVTILRGLGTDGLGGSNEPSLQWILDTLQIPVNVGDPDKTNNDMPAGSALIGDEVAITSFTKAAFDHVVEVEALSLFGPAGPAGNPNVVTVGIHATAQPSSRTLILSGPNTSNQTVLPAVTTLGEYDLETPFGFDFTWHGLSDRVAYSEDSLNTWDPTNKHKVRVYQLKNPDGSVVDNAYIVAPEDVLTPVDFQDAVIIVRNVKPAATAGLGKITSSVSELVFSGVKGTTTATQPITISNTGTTPLVISAAAVTGVNAASFSFTGGPQTLAPGETAGYTARFNPASSVVGPQTAALTISSDDPARPTLFIGLYGLATNGEQGNNEPPLKSVVDVLGRPINVGGTGLILGINPSPIGDEIAAPLFVRAGTGPVTMKPVARYSPDELLPFGWYSPNTGDPVLHQVATIALDQEQTLNPAIVAGGAAGFDPGTETFGFYVKSVSFGRNSYSQDGLNTNIPHAVRTYPAKDRAGNLIPNTYLVAFEDAQNGDYQDYVFEVSNAKPAVGSTLTSPVARIDFQPATSTVATGYLADTGAAFAAARGYGWVIPGTSTALDMTAQTRDRAGTGDPRLRTLILMQPTPAQSPTGPGAWEYAVPNGTYLVTLAVGDSGFVDSTHRIQVEGLTLIPGFTPSTANPSITVSGTVTVADGKLTVDAVGGANTKLQYIDIDKPETGSDTTAPTVSTSISGLQQSAGVYKNKATITVNAADVGGIASTSYSLDGGAFVSYTGPVEVTTPGSHTVRSRAQDIAGNLATSSISTFTVVIAGVSLGNIALENLDGVPYSDRLTMNRIQNPQTGTTCQVAGCDPAVGPFVAANVVHDVAVLRIRNTGTEALNVTGLELTGPFSLVNVANPPLLIGAGGFIDVPVRFTATTIGANGGLWSGTLTVTSDDSDEPALPVQLAGFWQSVSEGGQEPDVAEIVKLFGYGTAITASGTPLNENGLVHATGDEVFSPYWLRSNPALPVTVRQLGAFHTQGNTASFFWHVKGSNSTTNLFTHAGAEGQSILPHRNGSTTVVAGGSFAPAGAFGLKIDSEWSDPTKNSQTADVANGCVGACGSHVRIWAVRDRSGAIVPNTWLVGMDYSGINYDYNDNIYLVSNMKPESAANPGTPALLPGAAALQLGFDTTIPATLVDKDEQGIGFVTTQPNKVDLAVGNNSYNKMLLDLDLAAPGTLKVTTSGTATAGTNGAADNTLVNGTRLPFDGSGGVFTIGGRILGPLTELNVGSEQAGIMFGPDQDNYIKVVAIAKNGVPSIEFYAEQAGVGVTIGATVVIPAAATLASLDLALVADPSTGQVWAAYRINDGSYVLLPTALTLPATAIGRFFDRQSQAGIIASHKGGTEFIATFDSFGITNGNILTAPAPRQAIYRLDVAGSADYVDSIGNTWTPDTGRYSPATAVAEGSTVVPIAGTVDDTLFLTYRGNVGNVAQNQRVISYTLPAKGATSVDLMLSFAERAAGNNAVGKRLFNIEVEGKTVRTDFDIFAAAGAINTAVQLPINGIAIVGNTIDITLRASVDYPSIAAIEVLCQGVCVLDATPPAVPTGLGGTAATGGITVDWADNAEADLLGYNIFRSTTAAGPFGKLNAAPLTTSTYLDSSVTASTGYFYQVSAVDSSENTSAATASLEITSAAPPAQAPVRINTGGPAVTTGGVAWAADKNFTGGKSYTNGAVTAIAGTTDDVLYFNERSATADLGTFSYAIPVLNGTYQVKLHLAEIYHGATGGGAGGTGKRVFSVNIEGGPVELANFDMNAAAAPMTAIVRSYNVTVTDAKVDIAFSSTVNQAKIAAIEILPVVIDTVAPAVVAGLTATGSAAGVSVGWAASAATDLAGYNVYRSASANGTYTKVNAALVTGLSLTDAAAPQGVPSFYQVTAVDTSGNESVRPVAVSATRPDTTPPAVLVGLTATGSAAGISVGWAASAATDLAGYNVYRSASANGAYVKVNAALLTGLSLADAAAPQGVVSFYQVTAVDGSGNESVRSATVSALRPDTVAPAVVAGLTATGSAAGVSVGWAASAATDLAGYNVYRSASANGTYTKVNAALVTGLSLADAAAPQGVPSFYQVTAVDTSGNESVRPVAVSATRPDTTPPAVLVGLTATGSAAGISVGWAASAATDLAGYNVYRSASANGAYTKQNAALLSGTSYLDSAASVGAAFFYQVTAVDTTGNESNRSATTTATRPDVTAPSVVTGVNAVGATGGNTVGWAASPATDLAGYNVFRSSTATGTYIKLNTALLTGLTSLDSAAPVAVASFYQVTAVDTAGNESERSATVNATRPAPPAAGSTIRINSGGPAVTTGGVTWAADQYFTGGKPYSNPRVSAIGATTDDVLFRSERSATANLAPFSYSIPVANGTYDVTLYFAEIYHGATGGGAGGTGKRVFSANLEGGPVELANFDLNAVAAPMTAVARTFRVAIVDGKVDIAFTATVNQPKVSAIAVLPVTPGTRPTIRINAGGSAQTIAGTTFSACTALAACNNWVSGGFAYAESDTITGLPAGTNAAMFQSEWTGGATAGAPVVAVGARAFGFQVPVANGNYRVKLYFAELNKTTAGTRTFDVRLENTTVLSNFDIFVAAAGIDRAIVREFAVTVTDGIMTIDFLRRIENAKISAIEIIPA